ncbi:hypothetical protein D3C74_185510 [compost metagenome]
MIKRKKLLLSGAAIALALSSFAVGAAGAGRFQLIVNGKTATTEVKVINNTTYVPLRAVSEMLGAKVTFNSATGTITINSDGAAVVPSTPPSQDTPTNPKSSENSRLNPAEIGTTLPFAVKNILDEYSGNVSISQVIRGDEAWRMIHEANMFNNEPADGYEYMLVKAKVAITKNTKSDAAVDLWGGDFTLVSATGTAYDTQAVVTPDPKLDASIYVGSSNEGWVAFQVKKSDQSPLIVFERKYDGSGGVWFKTK